MRSRQTNFFFFLPVGKSRNGICGASVTKPSLGHAKLTAVKPEDKELEEDKAESVFVFFLPIEDV